MDKALRVGHLLPLYKNNGNGNKMKKLLLIQPGAFGDIILCVPIAKYYFDKGYEIYWPVRKKFLPLLSQIDYVKPIILDEETLDPDWLRSDVMKILPMRQLYDRVINLADRGPHPTAERMGIENFEQCKYRLSEVPIENKHNLEWSRNEEREDSLFSMVTEDKKDYAFCHLESSRGDRAELPSLDRDVVEASVIDGYGIYDWYKVIKNASVVFCVESSIHQFIDGFITTLTAGCHTLPRGSYQKSGGDCYSPFWNKRYMK